jgi:hypothetical protein
LAGRRQVGALKEELLESVFKVEFSKLLFQVGYEIPTVKEHKLKIMQNQGI